MQYWRERYVFGDGYYDQGFGYLHGDGEPFSPGLLVTGVKLEEVVLNAILV